ncbi:MAG: hypothetical protein WDN67_00570 [Candidatus Moraniibacteriota bacterium]
MAYLRNFDGESNGAVANYANGNAGSGSPTFTIDDTVFFGGSGKSLKLSNNSTNNQHSWKYDSASELDSGDGTYECVMRLGTVNDAGRCRTGFVFRGNSGGTTCYVAMIRPTNTGTNTTIRLSRYSGGTETAVATFDYGSVILTNTWYHLKVFASGSALKARAWKDGDSEPSTWQIDTTDATYDNTNKKTGFFFFNSVTSLGESYIDSISETAGGGITPNSGFFALI